jgi:PAS domain S-box-containing protein
MHWSLRRHILLTLAPLLALLVLLGGAGLVLLHYLGGRADAILRENYDSVRAMERLGEATERIDSSFQFTLAGKEADARAAYDTNWKAFEEQFRIEEQNITIFPEEQELVEALRQLKRRYREQGDRFYAHPARGKQRYDDYFGEPGPVRAGRQSGLLATFREIKQVSGDILRLNQENMEQASRDAKATARTSLLGFGAGLLVAGFLAVLLGLRIVRALLKPLEEVTRAAKAIGAGQLNQTVPVWSPDELGQLAEAFNTMTQHLHDYRQSNTARLLRAQQTSQATIDSFTDPVLVVDLEGRVELANPAARQLLGVAPTQGDGTRPAVWVAPEPLRQPLADALQSQRPYLTESFDQTVSFQAGGAERSYLPQVRPIRDSHGNILGAAVVLDDVTRFRLLDRFKSDLVATASHELKTPLTSIRLAVHVLLEEAVGPLEPKQIELLLDARENTERLLRIIESLLALARLEHGETLQLQPESPAALVRAAAEAAASRAEDKHIQIVVEADEGLPQVEVDPVQFGHALGNLLNNALGYTESGGRVTLSAAATQNGKVHLSVADTGVGIPVESLPHVFTRFFRVPGQGRPPGTGLGLTIVREIVLAHRGEITCESEPGKGTTFHILLPARKEAL